MNTKIVAFASAMLAAASLTSAAEAGGGVRLGFGGPLGTFVATPAHGGGGGGGYEKPSKRKVPDQQAARGADKPARLAKAQETKNAPNKAEPVTATAASEGPAPAVTGSSALIQGSIPAEGTTETPVTSTIDTSAQDRKAEASPGTDVKTVTAATDQAGTEADGTGCKKFIPAVGMTVTVGCGE